MMRPQSKIFLGVFLIVILSALHGLTGAQESFRITGISVEGNVRSEESLILFTSGLSVGDMLAIEDVQDAVRGLYALGIFSHIEIYGDLRLEGVKLRIVVQENPILNKVSFKGNDKIDEDELEEDLAFVEGRVIRSSDVEEGKQTALKLYEKEGYLLAQVDHEISPSESAGVVDLVFKIDEGEKVQVKQIRVLNTETFSASKIKKQMETKEDRWWRGGDFKEDTYQEDLVKIVDFYRREGYPEAAVVSDSIYYDGAKRNLFVDITVEEGSQYRLGEVTWEGNAILPGEVLLRRMDIEEGAVYNKDKREMSQLISAAYAEMGYLTARGLPYETVRDQVVDVRFEIDEGEPSKVSRVMIVGNTKTKDKVIRREILVKPGQVYRQSAVMRSQREIYMLNFFKDIQIEPAFLESGDVDLTFRVEEKATGTASMGVGYSERDKLIGTIGLSVPNLLGNGQQLDFNWEFGTRRTMFRVGFLEPWLLDTPTSLHASVYRTNWRFLNAFDEIRQSLNFGVGRRLTWPDSYSRVSLGYRLEEFRYEDFHPDYTGYTRDILPQTTSGINATYARDTRDLPEFPTRGSVFSYTPELATSALGGDVGYHKHMFRTSFFFPTIWKLVLSLDGRLGMIKGFSAHDDANISFWERFTPGGVDLDGQVRGYEDRTVGPRDALPPEGNLEGGRAMLVFNLEYRFPIVEQQIYGLLFADAGNAWSKPSKIDAFDLKRSVGVGVRVMAPVIGLIGFDFGYGFDRPSVDGGSASWKTHFQFGPRFY